MSLTRTSLCVILFDVSPQANKILQPIHFSKCFSSEIRICQMQHTLTCASFLYDAKQSDKLTTKRWWIFFRAVHVTLCRTCIFMASNCVRTVHAFEIYCISVLLAMIRCVSFAYCHCRKLHINKLSMEIFSWNDNLTSAQKCPATLSFRRS